MIKQKVAIGITQIVKAYTYCVKKIGISCHNIADNQKL